MSNLDRLYNVIEQRQTNLVTEQNVTRSKYFKRGDSVALRIIHENNKDNEIQKKANKILNFGTVVSRTRIIQRLRKLLIPATLFGDKDILRYRRLRNAEEAEVRVDVPSYKFGIQENVSLMIQTEEKDLFEANRLLEKRSHIPEQKLEDTQRNLFTQTIEKQMVKVKEMKDFAHESFKRAAERVKNKLTDEKMSIEDQCLKWIRNWCVEWKMDLESRPPQVSRSARGKRASDEYITSIRGFRYLFAQLRSRSLSSSIKTGIWLMLKAMQEKNYIHANAVLLNTISIGNAPWPIGVTQVGIHTKSAAREKISTSHLNTNAAAHIMGDEATRKYLHGLKRLLTVLQRIYPAVPSRAVEFRTDADMARGSSGSGSCKLALIEADLNGDITQPRLVQSLVQYDTDCSIKVPPRLTQLLETQE